MFRGNHGQRRRVEVHPHGEAFPRDVQLEGAFVQEIGRYAELGVLHVGRAYLEVEQKNRPPQTRESIVQWRVTLT